MKKLFMWSLFLLLCATTSGYVIKLSPDAPNLLTFFPALGVWVGGLGWLWNKYKFKRSVKL